MRRIAPAIVLLAATLLLAVPSASAVYVVTPLRAHVDDPAVDVGDNVTVVIEPENETTAAEWAGKLVHAYYAYDTAESSDDPDAASSDATYRRTLIDDALQLDERAHATLSWTVPADVDDRNVAIRIESAEGELLAVVDVAVGDAPPVMRALAGSGGEEPLPPETAPETPPAQNTQDDDAKDVPAAGLLAAISVVAIAALALRRRFG